MTLTTIILLIIVGLLVVLIEIFFVPGSTIVGLIGFALILFGVIGAFLWLPRSTSFMVLGAVMVVLIGLIALGFRAKTWERFAVRSTIDGKVPADSGTVAVGEEGVTLTRCAPIGKARFGTSEEEVYSLNDFIEANVPIVVAKIRDKKIIVKPKTSEI